MARDPPWCSKGLRWYEQKVVDYLYSRGGTMSEGKLKIDAETDLKLPRGYGMDGVHMLKRRGILLETAKSPITHEGRICGYDSVLTLADTSYVSSSVL